MSYGQTLSRLRKSKGITQIKAAEYLSRRLSKDCSHKVVSHWEKGVSSPSVEQFLLLCELYGVDDIQGTFRSAASGFIKSPRLSALGKSRVDEYIAMLLTNPLFSESALVSQRELDNKSGRYSPDIALSKRSLSEYDLPERGFDTNDLSEYNSLECGLAERVLPKRDFMCKTIKLFTVPAAAGTGTFLDGEHYVDLDIDDTVPENADFAVRVSGDSMEPRFYDGQVIFIQEKQTVNIGEIGVFSLNGNSYVKKLGRGELLSLNPGYAPIEFNEFDTLRVFGKVVG